MQRGSVGVRKSSRFFCGRLHGRAGFRRDEAYVGRINDNSLSHNGRRNCRPSTASHDVASRNPCPPCCRCIPLFRADTQSRICRGGHHSDGTFCHQRALHRSRTGDCWVRHCDRNGILGMQEVHSAHITLSRGHLRRSNWRRTLDCVRSVQHYDGGGLLETHAGPWPVFRPKQIGVPSQGRGRWFCEVQLSRNDG